MGTRLACAVVVAALILLFVSSASGVTGTGGASTSQKPISMNGISGTTGILDGPDVTGTNTVSEAKGTYGFECSGSTCEGADNPVVANALYAGFKYQSQQGEPTSFQLISAVTTTNKVSFLSSVDWHCPAPAGPPAFSAEGKIKVSEIKYSTTAIGGMPFIPNEGTGGGYVGASFTHSSPSTGPTAVDEQNGGPVFATEHGGPEDNYEWDVDPGDDRTFQAQATVSVWTEFDGSAAEITATANLKADVILSAELITN